MKPHPAPAREALRLLGRAPEQTCLIGDSLTDIEAAHGVGGLSSRTPELLPTPSGCAKPTQPGIINDIATPTSLMAATPRRTVPSATLDA